MTSSALIVVLSRFPKPGRTKTRLIPALGAEEAARIHRELAGRTVLVARVASATVGGTLELHGTGASPRAFRNWLGPLVYRSQAGGDLGQRMRAALSAHLEAGRGPALIVGTDCPWLEPRHIEEACMRLGDHDMVIGPALDGGYYLLGLRRPVPEIFRGIPWGTERVLEATLETGARLGLSVSLLAPLGDVDLPEDVDAWRRRRESPHGDRTASNRIRAQPSPARHPAISVIVPALDEATLVGAAVESARRDPGAEVIVVDGGSSDGTIAAALEQGARVLPSPPSRSLQQNLGALEARGDALVFLHADARLPERYGAEVRAILARDRVVGGAFRLEIEGDAPGLRFVERTTDWRARVLRMPYGDQALFLTRSAFLESGGFATLPIMEDYEWVRRLRRRGRIAISRRPTTVSARRWERVGVWRTTWINRLMLLGYGLGVAPESLARFYRKKR